MTSCDSCGQTGKLQVCGTCKTACYCSKDCQKTHFKQHKYVCRSSNDAQSSLRQMPEVSVSSSSTFVSKLFNTAEIRMTFMSCLAAKDLLKAQSVCRQWYRTIELESILQERLFLAQGPSKPVFPAFDGNEMARGITPRNKSQLQHAEMTKRPVMAGGSPYLVTNAVGNTQELEGSQLAKAGIPLVLNPFFTKLWPQDPSNMTNKPYIATSTTNKTASWRRMHITSPPMLQLDMSVWYTSSSGKGSQKRPGTGKIATGVRLGHLADLLGALPKDQKLHWMSIDGYAWWARSSDAVVVPDPDHDGGNNASVPGVYVNPSNGIAFPGGF